MIGMLSGCAKPGNTLNAPWDQAGPFINISKYEYTTTINQPIDFDNITGYDDVDGLLPTDVEGYINYSKAGDYYPVITCTDFSGNESKVGITIHVVEKVDTTPDATPPVLSDHEAKDPTACDIPSAKDTTAPCNEVLVEDLNRYQTVYEGEAGKEKCEAVQNAQNSGSCEVIQTNIGTFWGYGYVSQPAAEATPVVSE